MALHDFEKPLQPGDYITLAINALYPTLRNGVDFQVSRTVVEPPDPDTFAIEKNGVMGAVIDDEDVMAECVRLIEADPNAYYVPPEEPEEE